MSIISRAIALLRNEGLLRTLKQVFIKCLMLIIRIPNMSGEIIFKRSKVARLRETVKGKKVFIVIPSIDWHTPLFQRMHQIASALSKLDNCIVLFVSDQARFDNFCFSEMISQSLYLYSIRAISSLDDILGGTTQTTLVMYWPKHYGLLSRFKYDKFVYEYVDEMRLSYYYSETVEKQHIELLQLADLTTATADILYQKAKPYAKKLILCPNAGDYDFFKAGRECDTNNQLSSITDKYQCIFGYYGALAAWFDYELVIEIAKRRPDWAFILIGYDYDDTVSKVKGAALDNVRYLGPRPYEDLPSYVSGFDIQIIPFVVNEITMSTSPVKLFEYMASGKPILTSDMPECRKYSSVYRYSDSNDFVEKAQRLMQLKNDLDYMRILDREAAMNTWTSRVDQIINELETLA